MTGTPVIGSRNLVYKLEFSDGVTWALKIPKDSHPDDYSIFTAAMLTLGVYTQQFVRRETTIPVSEIYEYDVNGDNDLGVPFVLMEFIEGVSARRVWGNCEKHGLDDQEELATRRRRVQILHDTAAAIQRLSKFAFSQFGGLKFTPNSEIWGIGSMWEWEYDTGECDCDAHVIFIGPFESAEDFYKDMSKRRVSDMNVYNKWAFKFVEWLAEADHSTTFTLVHPDLHGDNILVDKDGHLKGLIDWELAFAVPRGLGNQAYPQWLNEDFVHSSRSQEKDPFPDCECKSGNLYPPDEEYVGSLLLESTHAEDDYYRTIWRKCAAHYSTRHTTARGGKVQEFTVDKLLAGTPRTYVEGLTEQFCLGVGEVRNITDQRGLMYDSVLRLLSNISVLDEKRPHLLEAHELPGNTLTRSQPGAKEEKLSVDGVEGGRNLPTLARDGTASRPASEDPEQDHKPTPPGSSLRLPPKSQSDPGIGSVPSSPTKSQSAPSPSSMPAESGEKLVECAPVLLHAMKRGSVTPQTMDRVKGWFNYLLYVPSEPERAPKRRVRTEREGNGEKDLAKD